MRRYIVFAIVIIATIACGIILYNSNPSFLSVKNEKNTAAVFFVDKITVEALQQQYNPTNQNQKKIKILIVPGHEPDYGGAEFKTLLERDMNVALADKLTAILKKDSKLEVIQSRDYEVWNPELLKYFTDNFYSIQNWVIKQKLVTQTLIDNQIVVVTPENPRAPAPVDVAMRLYGINKWAGENSVDITIHIHFNDIFRRSNRAGEYSGIAIYIPEKQFSNSLASRKIAESIFSELNKKYATSTTPKESVGVIEDQDLIAVGSFNTVDTASVLIEYGYIYETKFSTRAKREKFYTDASERTAKGLKEFLSGINYYKSPTN